MRDIRKHTLTLSATVCAAVLSALCLAPTGAVAAGDANQSSCPAATEESPGFRSYLPDCRAFEMATPQYEGGSQPRWVFDAPPPVSANGEHLLSQNLAGAAGAENDPANGSEFGAIYELSRTASGWSEESLEPPASLSARRGFVGAGADLSRSLWELMPQSSAGTEAQYGEGDYTLDVREARGSGGSCPPGGVAVPRACFTEVGPKHYSEAKAEERASEADESELDVAGASRDLSHIVLFITSAPNRLWPGDETRAGDQSLYEYVGTGNSEPTLVGVKNEGSLEGKPDLNEGAELVSECGTVLGAGAEGDAYNAISGDGETVFFTALHTEGCSGSQPAVDEIYARVGGSKTVAISEPSKEACGACVETTKADAVFQGASEDGSKVFFTTAQELLPGQKGTNLYEYDFDAEAGHRVTLVSAGSTEPEVQGVARISEDGSHVYYEAGGVLTTTPNGNGEAAEAGGYNLYSYDTEARSTSFVATLLTAAEEHEIDQEVESGEYVQAVKKNLEHHEVTIGGIEARIEELETEIAEATAEATEKNEEVTENNEEVTENAEEVQAVESQEEAEECASEPSSAVCEELAEEKEGLTEAGEELAEEGEELAEAEEELIEVRAEAEEQLTEEQEYLAEEEGELSQEAAELAGEITAQETERVPRRTGVNVTDEFRPFETTPDGQYLVFVNARDLLGTEDTSTVGQAFEYDTQTHDVVRVSAGQKSAAFPAGYNGNGNTTNTAYAAGILTPTYRGHMEPTEPGSALSIAEDGMVVFYSQDALTPQAVEGAGRENIYEYREGRLYLISAGDEATPLSEGRSRLLGMDESGTDVFFSNADGLVPQDTDTQTNWWVAREGGGFPAPVSPPAGCVGDACQGTLSAMPFLALAGSATQTAGENLPPAISKTAVKPKPKPLTRAQKLAKALKACRAKRKKKKQAGCIRHARKRYGPKAKKKRKKSSGRSK